MLSLPGVVIPLFKYYYNLNAFKVCKECIEFSNTLFTLKFYDIICLLQLRRLRRDDVTTFGGRFIRSLNKGIYGTLYIR